MDCRACRHFDDDPRSLEVRLPGLAILGSAFSSTRADAGLCAALDRFQSPLASRRAPVPLRPEICQRRVDS
jgi:hypothetical protein